MPGFHFVPEDKPVGARCAADDRPHAIAESAPLRPGVDRFYVHPVKALLDHLGDSWQRGVKAVELLGRYGVQLKLAHPLSGGSVSLATGDALLRVGFGVGDLCLQDTVDHEPSLELGHHYGRFQDERAVRLLVHQVAPARPGQTGPTPGIGFDDLVLHAQHNTQLPRLGLRGNVSGPRPSPSVAASWSPATPMI